MKRLLATILVSLCLVSSASAAVPTMVDEGGGGSSTPQVYIIESYTYDSNGFPIFLYCRYIDFGNGVVIQDSCWT